jgi:hypothetical protein
MGLGAAAVVPHPPLLVGALAGEHDDTELARLRAACLAAVAAVAVAELLVVVGDGPVWGAVVPGAAGSLADWGAGSVRLELGATTAPELAGVPEPAPVTHLPLSLTVAAWLLAQVDPPAHLVAFCVPAAMPPAAAAGIGRALAAAAGQRRAALLVMADGSARRTKRSPGTFHPGAAAADAAVAAALAGADLGALLALDPAACSELWLGGRVPLQVMAGALGATPLAGRVLYDAAPAGVGYVVATCLAAP